MWPPFPFPRLKRVQSTENLSTSTPYNSHRRIRHCCSAKFASSYRDFDPRAMDDQPAASPSPMWPQGQTLAASVPGIVPKIPPRSSSRVASGLPRGGEPSSRPTSPLNGAKGGNSHPNGGWTSAFPARDSPSHIQWDTERNRVGDRGEGGDGKHVEDPVGARPQTFSPPDSASTPSPNLPRSGTESIASTHRTNATSLCPLQAREGGDMDDFLPLFEDEVEPGSFDLLSPALGPGAKFSLEERSEQLFSREHLAIIFDDPILLTRFTSFVRTSRPASVPLLAYYFDALKAMKALKYSNALVDSLSFLEDHDFAFKPIAPAVNASLEERVEMAFDALVRDELPAYITHIWIQMTSSSMRKRITGTLPSHLRQMSEGLAEVFCLTDPSRKDNPIIFASEEFYRTTQYGMGHALGRNCRFLQGPKTNPASVERLRKQLAQQKEHYETLLNYRRDGSPFMNLLMCAPLLDSRGNTRYMIGAQVEVSGLVKDCAGLESLRRLVNKTNSTTEQLRDQDAVANANPDTARDAAFHDLSDMLSGQEIETVRKHGGDMYRLHREGVIQQLDKEEVMSNWPRPRVVIRDESSWNNSYHHHRFLDSPSSSSSSSSTSSGNNRPNLILSLPPPPPPPADLVKGSGGGSIYEHYVLVRPHPSLRILFASPALRIPGMLQTPFLSRIGGPDRVRDELGRALADGTAVVTARVRWLVSSKHHRNHLDSSSSRNSSSNASGGGEGGGGDRSRWIHCTPLIGGNGAVGVWMVVFVDDDDEGQAAAAAASLRKKSRVAAPVDANIGAGRRGGSTTCSRVGGRVGGETRGETRDSAFNADDLDLGPVRL